MTRKDVGFGRPPKEYQYAPGRSGNPSGRPKRLPTMADVAAAELTQRVRIADDDLELKVSKQEAMIKALVDAAVKGNQRAIATVIALCNTSETTGPHDSDAVDESILDEFIEREVELRLKARGSREEPK